MPEVGVRCCAPSLAAMHLRAPADAFALEKEDRDPGLILAWDMQACARDACPSVRWKRQEWLVFSLCQPVTGACFGTNSIWMLLHAEGDLLADQVDSVKKAAEMVSQLRRVGKGLGVYQFDKDLQ